MFMFGDGIVQNVENGYSNIGDDVRMVYELFGSCYLDINEMFWIMTGKTLATVFVIIIIGLIATAIIKAYIDSKFQQNKRRRK